MQSASASSATYAQARAAPHIAKEWIVAAPHPRRDDLARDAGLSPLLAQLLLVRGAATTQDVRRFMTPDFRELLPPEALPGAVAAADRLHRAAADGCPIVIYGDYDVDGVTASAILWHALRYIGASVRTYVPSRFEEGYGLNSDAIRKLAEEGAQAIVTVDCGITACEQARLARELGVELIITDHHEPKSDLPDASVLVHPTALAERCPNPNLSGAGVALKVAWAIAQRHAGASRVGPELRELLLDATALAAMGLVADMVPLTGENRLIASFGLRHLCKSRNPGLRALVEAAGLERKAAVDDYDVGFLLAPRLNAVGRMGHAREAVELLTTADDGRAREIATALDGHNRERQEVEKRILAQAETMVVERDMHRDGCRGIVLASEAWHTGVVGIVASRLIERFHRPTVLIALSNGVGQGSARSIRNFPLHESLARCGEHLLSHGGHAMAAGLRIETARVEAFTRAFLDDAAQRLTQADLTPRLNIDDEVELGQVDLALAESIARMQPFGIGNARPRLVARGLELADEPRVVGAGGAHLQFTVRCPGVGAGARDGGHRKAIAFGRGSDAVKLTERRRLDLAFEPIVNEWMGRKKVELKVVDWRLD